MVMLSRTAAASLSLLALATLATPACRRPADGPKSIRLVDVFDAKRVEGSAAGAAAAPVRRTECASTVRPPARRPRPLRRPSRRPRSSRPLAAGRGAQA